MRRRHVTGVLWLGLLWTGSALGVDRWAQPVRATRWLHRETHHADGAPLRYDAVWVDLCDPAVGFRVTAPGEGPQTVSSWATRRQAALAINGDYFDIHSHVPLGPLRGAGRWWEVPRREHRDTLLLLNANGGLALLEAAADVGPGPWTWRGVESQVEAQWTEVLGIREQLVLHGSMRRSPWVPVQNERHPRTALGLSRDGHTLVLLVVDGRRSNAAGASPRELSELLVRHGAYEGLKLDGGGSTTLFFQGLGVVNQPSDGHERAVVSHLGIQLSDQAEGHRAGCRDGLVGPELPEGFEVPPGS